MLMNFAKELDPFRPKPVFRGGRWRDRLHAKKSLRPRDKIKSQPHGNLTGSNTQTSVKTRQFGQEKEEGRPEKRLKISKDETTSQQKNHAKTNHSKPKDGGAEIISSLFTSNPSTKSHITASKEPNSDHPPPTPSNAPLPPALHNFTSLGMSLSLSAHINRTLSLTAPTAIQKAALPQLLTEDADAFIQAETGSGKTLAYLLPIVQRILALTSTTSTSNDTANTDQKPNQITRSSGLFALILAPTRELTHQIQLVLTQLLSKYPNIVAGAVTGGATKNHEKARLRKGLNILVATPGRLVDHLENTAVLDLGRVRWLVLDEGDRLMEMGFEEDVRKVLEAIEGGVKKKKVENRAVGETEVQGLPEKRTTILCSATMKMGVQRLGEMSLKDAALIKVDEVDAARPDTATTNPTLEPDQDPTNSSTSPPSPFFRPPTQLYQSYILTPPKQRLVTLFALLNTTFPPQPPPTPVRKALIFLSCADSVDFHYEILKKMLPPQPSTSKDSATTVTDPASNGPTPTTTTTAPSLHRLHASLSPPSARTTVLQTFRTAPAPAILLTTDVSARGLDMPDIDLVIEYDPAFSVDEHLHRVGRTARAGRGGKGVVFLLSGGGSGGGKDEDEKVDTEGEEGDGAGGKESTEGQTEKVTTGGGEEGYIQLLQDIHSRDNSGATIHGELAETVLKKGFSSNPPFPSNPPTPTPYQTWAQAATTLQLAIESHILSLPALTELARKAFKSHIRAYATHVRAERGVFDVRGLQLGHLCKGFGIRDRPGGMGRIGRSGGGRGGKRGGMGKAGGIGGNKGGKVRREGEGTGRKGMGEGKRRVERDDDGGGGGGGGEEEAGRKMREMVKRMGKAGRAGGGVEEFNIG